MRDFRRSDGLFQDSSRYFRGSVLLFDLTFIMQILSETGVKVIFEFGLTIMPVPAIDMFL